MLTHTPLTDALHAQLAARLDAAETLMLIFGPDEDIPRVVEWVIDPHGPDPTTVEEIERETQQLRDFTAALYAHMTWESPGGGW